jgi:type II secretory pathway component PulM
MNRLRALIAEAQRYFAQLSARERLMLVVMGITSVLFVGGLVLSSFFHSISRHELSIIEKSANLQKVAIYAQRYAENKRKQEDLEMKLKGPPTRLISELSGLAEKHGLTISSINERGEQNLDKVKESLVELQIASAPINQLNDLLNDIEHETKLMKVRKLRLRPTGGADSTALNAILTIGTYQLVAAKDQPGGFKGGE